jgi:RES domain-containing protein
VPKTTLDEPLLVWRILPRRRLPHAFDGEGARRFGGRWNHPGVRMVYTSETLSLAALEVFVHLDPEDAPDDLVAVSAELPAGVDVARLEPTALPADWRSYPGPESLRDLGSAWVGEGRTVALRVPSAVIPQEFNVLLNPGHPAFTRIRPRQPTPFSFDPRMWKRDRESPSP